MALTKAKTNMLAPKATEQEAKDAVEGSWTDPAAVHAAFNQYGLGEISQVVKSLNTAVQGFYSFANSDPDNPYSGAGGCFINQKHTANFTVQTAFMAKSAGQTFSRLTTDNGATWSNWIEFYNSGNSVNPLDYGIGGDPVNVTDWEHIDASNGGSFVYGYQAQNNPTSDGISNAHSPSCVAFSADNEQYVNLFGAHFGVNESTQNRWVGITSGTANGLVDWTNSEWVEFYHNGNLNVDEFGCDGTGDVIATGYMATGSSARFVLPVSSINTPSSITVSGTFKVTGVNASDVVASNVTTDISLGIGSSYKVAYINVSNLTGATIGDTLQLLSESSSSKITVNY